MKRTRFILTTILAVAFVPARAAVIYSDLHDIPIPTSLTGIYLDLETGATGSDDNNPPASWDINPTFGGVLVYNSDVFQAARSAAGNTDPIVRLNVGNAVGGSLIFSTGFGVSGVNGVPINPADTHLGAAGNQFATGTEGFIGFKFTPAGGGGEKYGWMRVILTANTSGALIKDWAYEDGGGSIVTGRVQQGAVISGTQLVTLSPATGETFTLGSALTDTGGNTNSVLKTGAGSTILAAANTFTGTTTVNDGTLTAGAVGALGGTAAITVDNGGTLLLAGAGAIDRVNDAAGLTLNGGTLSMAGLSSASETLEVLTLSANSTLDFGTGDTNTLAFSSLALGGFTLTVNHWTGTFYAVGETTDHGPASQDRLRFSSLSLTGAQLAQIRFYDDAGAFIGTGQQISFGGTPELVPVPEPTTTFGALALLGLVGYRERRRFLRVENARSADRNAIKD